MTQTNRETKGQIQSLRCPGDVLVLPAFDDCWVVMNVFSKTCLGLDSSGLAHMRQLAAGNEDKFTASVWEIEWFSNLDGLLSDPSRFIRNEQDWPVAERLNEVEFSERLQQHCLLIADEIKYRARFDRKRNVLDREQFGTFHEQVGQHLMMNKRVLPEDWWLSQKFNDDVTALRENLYGAIQGSFLPKYFQQRFGAGTRVVDIGCGPGYFANIAASTGATVLGVDPNEAYIKIARGQAGDNAQFEVMDIGTKGGCNSIPSHSADYVFISDALLFYFVTHDSFPSPNIDLLFDDIRRILKPNGTLICLEPHYIFWLNPWLGDEDRPFTIITEYQNPAFRVTETLGGLIQAFAKGGFTVNWMEELRPSKDFLSVNPRAYHFASEFPLWHLFELSPKIETAPAS